MRIVPCAALLVMLSAVGAMSPTVAAQATPAAALKSFASSADVAAVIAKLKAERGDKPMLAGPLLPLAPYSVNIEYRVAVANAAVHEKEAELFYVLDGAGTMVTGGKLVGATRPNPDNQAGTAIEGGTSRHVAKGDFVMVPEGTAHWFSAIDGSLTLMSLHLPRAAK